MKKNNSVIILSFLLVVVTTLLIFFLKDKLMKNNTIRETDTIAINENIITKTESNKEITYIIEDNRNNITYSWTFNKDEKYNESIKKNITIPEKLGLEIISDNENSKIDNLTNVKNKMVISFDHHGVLPTRATVKIKVNDKFNDGQSLYLYYYNEEENIIEFIDKNIKIKNGYAEFEIDHCSDYFLTASIVQEAVNNPKNINIIIIVMIIIVLVLIASTLSQSGR